MKVIDLRKASAADAARKLYEWVREQAVAIGQKPDIECALYTPEQAEEIGYGRCWIVRWEAGPFEWGVHLTLGVSAFAGDSPIRDPEVLMTGAAKYVAEPHYGFDVGFIEDDGISHVVADVQSRIDNLEKFLATEHDLQKRQEIEDMIGAWRAHLTEVTNGNGR